VGAPLFMSCTAVMHSTVLSCSSYPVVLCYAVLLSCTDTTCTVMCAWGVPLGTGDHGVHGARQAGQVPAAAPEGGGQRGAHEQGGRPQGPADEAPFFPSLRGQCVLDCTALCCVVLYCTVCKRCDSVLLRLLPSCCVCGSVYEVLCPEAIAATCGCLNFYEDSGVSAPGISGLPYGRRPLSRSFCTVVSLYCGFSLQRLEDGRRLSRTCEWLFFSGDVRVVERGRAPVADRTWLCYRPSMAERMESTAEYSTVQYCLTVLFGTVPPCRYTRAPPQR